MITQQQRVEDIDLETTLIERVCTRDKAAFEELYMIYYKRLYRFLVRMIGDDAGIREVINDVMFVVWQKADSFNAMSKVSTWVFGIAVRVAKKHLSQQYAVNSRIDAAERNEGDDGAWEGFVEKTDALEKALATLTPDHRAVIDLTYFQGLNYREIAQIMNCPENTVKTRMFHARAKLREGLRNADDN